VRVKVSQGAAEQKGKPTMATIFEPRVNAIRLDSMVGKGTCSFVDECLTDADLVAQLDEAGITTAAAAVAYFRSAHETREAYIEEIRLA